MNPDHRRIHHLTQDESDLVLYYRLLSPPLRQAMLELLRSQADESAGMPSDKVVSFNRQTPNT